MARFNFILPLICIVLAMYRHQQSNVTHGIFLTFCQSSYYSTKTEARHFNVVERVKNASGEARELRKNVKDPVFIFM